MSPNESGLKRLLLLNMTIAWLVSNILANTEFEPFIPPLLSIILGSAFEKG